MLVVVLLVMTAECPLTAGSIGPAGSVVGVVGVVVVLLTGRGRSMLLSVLLVALVPGSRAGLASGPKHAKVSSSNPSRLPDPKRRLPVALSSLSDLETVSHLNDGLGSLTRGASLYLLLQPSPGRGRRDGCTRVGGAAGAVAAPGAVGERVEELESDAALGRVVRVALVLDQGRTGPWPANQSGRCGQMEQETRCRSPAARV